MMKKALTEGDEHVQQSCAPKGLGRLTPEFYSSDHLGDDCDL